MDYGTIISVAESYIEQTQKALGDLIVCYRGQAKDWKLKSKLRRAIDDGESIQEEKINWDNYFSTFENIARFQHYGGATRLLDYSTDINVALYFACSEHLNSDGVLYLCSYMPRTFTDLAVRVMSEVMMLKSETRLTDFVEDFLIRYPKYKNEKYFFNESEYSDEMFPTSWPYVIGKDKLALMIMSWIDHGFMVVPSEEDRYRIKSWNRRLYHQKGAFFITGNQIIPQGIKAFSWEIPKVTILPQLADLPDTITTSSRIEKILIPAESKKEILHVLRDKGITAKTLYLES